MLGILSFGSTITSPPFLNTNSAMSSSTSSWVLSAFGSNSIWPSSRTLPLTILPDSIRSFETFPSVAVLAISATSSLPENLALSFPNFSTSSFVFSKYIGSKLSQTCFCNCSLVKDSGSILIVSFIRQVLWLKSLKIPWCSESVTKQVVI